MKKSEINLINSLNSLFPKKNLGGELMKTALGSIPTIGPILTPLINKLSQTEPVKQVNPYAYNTANLLGSFMLGGPIDMNPPKGETVRKTNIPKPKSKYPPKESNLPGGSKSREREREKEFGGVINEGFKQYNGGSHDSGNDMSIDVNGNVSANTVATVQNKENMFKLGGKPYIMSDTLINPETQNTINKDAAMINKKYNKAYSTIDENNALNFEMKRLSNINDMLRAAVEKPKAKQMSGGGFPDDPPASNSIFDLGLTVDTNTNPIDVDVPFSLDFNPGTATDPTGISNKQFPFLARNLSDQNKAFKPRKKMDLTLDNFDIPAVGLKAIALGKSIADAATPALKEDLILPDYNRSDRYMGEANVDYSQAKQNAIGASNISGNVNRSSTSNFANFQAREQARTVSLGDAIANIDMQQSNANSQLALTRANYEQGKAVDNANRRYQNRVDNLQNQATADFADQKLFSEISQIGTEFNKYENFRRQLKNNKELQRYYINEGLAMLNAKNPNVKLDPNFVQKLQSGNYSIDDVVTVANMSGIKIQ